LINTYSPAGATLYTIKSHSARGISEYSTFSGEAESILLPATSFKIISKKVSSMNKGLYEIEVEEVAEGKLIILKFICFFYPKAFRKQVHIRV
jgi:hypothetical protein